MDSVRRFVRFDPRAGHAETHPERVSELILRGIYTLTNPEIEWYYQFGVSEMFTEKWALFQAPIPPDERHDMVAAYHRRLTGDDLASQLEAGRPRRSGRAIKKERL